MYAGRERPEGANFFRYGVDGGEVEGGLELDGSSSDMEGFRSADWGLPRSGGGA